MVGTLRWLVSIRHLFDLRDNTDYVGTFERITSNVEFRSVNAWSLVFAIMIASVGLNVNSAAVIIGAMLISPLMGPIVGAGFALATFDDELLRRSGRNLAAAVLISLVVSTIYFALSPIETAQSELLARTRPSFYDVLIAFFGGAAGIVAISRQHFSNIIPGVAIATALMPPLCTAGYGLANGRLEMFGGALYLFIINGVFISTATFLFVKYLDFPAARAKNPTEERKVQKWISVIATAVILPSLGMAWYLQKESYFLEQVQVYIRTELLPENIFVFNTEAQFSLTKPRAKLFVAGGRLKPGQDVELKSLANRYGLQSEAIEFVEMGASRELDGRIVSQLTETQLLAKQLQADFLEQRQKWIDQDALGELGTHLTAELKVFYSKLDSVRLEPGATKDQRIGGVKLFWRRLPKAADQERASRFIEARLEVPSNLIAHFALVNGR